MFSLISLIKEKKSLEVRLPQLIKTKPHPVKFPNLLRRPPLKPFPRIPQVHGDHYSYKPPSFTRPTRGKELGLVLSGRL